MEVRDLDGQISKWSMQGHLVGLADNRPRSNIHLAARKVLREWFVTADILEEVDFSPVKGKTLYFDFYIPLVKLAVEVQGEQHFKHVPFFHKNKMDFYLALKNDREKREWCGLNNITLVEFAFNEDETIWQKKLKTQ